MDVKPDMPVTRKVLARDLSPEERRVVEKLLGKGLGEDSQVEIREAEPQAAQEYDDLDPAERRRRWERFRKAADAMTEAVGPLTEEELDELLQDRPSAVSSMADAGHP